ncbi:MAG TPA: Ig-like domain-containing protein [Actinomycetota bacterium]|nr:Ig-like domain-containing protein [Actinomycetota bacterium]
MAYDSAREKTVLFSGDTDTNPPLADTWEWDGTTWTERSPATSPPARNLAAMAYDSTRGKTVLFSGNGTGGYLTDTWEWDGTTWTNVTPTDPTVSPPARSSAAMAYDSGRSKTVLFAGHDGSDLGDTWELTSPSPASELAVTSINGGSAPVAGSAFDVVVRSADSDGDFADVASDTGVELSLKSGTGTLGGTLTGTISDESDSVTISGVTYSKAESEVELTASTTSGDSLASGDSEPFTVVAGAAAKYLVTSNNASPVAGDQVMISAQLADANNNPVSTAGISAMWNKNLTTGSLSSPSSLTGANGVAQVTLSTSPTVGQSYTVTATDGVPRTGTSGPIITAASLLKNWAFELDANKDLRPDNWTSNPNFTRRNTVKFSGGFAGRHRSTGNANYTIQQTVLNLVAAKTYNFSGPVNVQPTNDDFSLSIQIQWRNNANNPVGTAIVVKQYTKANANGTWDEGASQDLLAPAGATRARIAMVVKKLNATVYVDQFSFREQPA